MRLHRSVARCFFYQRFSPLRSVHSRKTCNMFNKLASIKHSKWDKKGLVSAIEVFMAIGDGEGCGTKCFFVLIGTLEKPDKAHVACCLVLLLSWSMICCVLWTFSETNFLFLLLDAVFQTFRNSFVETLRKSVAAVEDKEPCSALVQQQWSITTPKREAIVLLQFKKSSF